MLPLHHGPKRTTRIERASSGWRPGALPSELRPQSARLESNQRACRIRALLSTELRAFKASGRNRTRTPAVQRACAAVDTTEAEVEMAGVEPAPPRCKRGALPPELHPQGADGWSRTTTARGTRVTAWGAHPCSASARYSTSRRVARRREPPAGRGNEGWPTGFEPTLRGSRPRVLAVTPRPPCERRRPDSNRHPLA